MPNKKDISDTRLFQMERHPDFDAEWAVKEKLVWWFAQKLARIVNANITSHGKRKMWWTPQDFIGWLTIRFNYSLHMWNKERGEFSTVFQSHLIGHAIRCVVKIDRELGTRTDEFKQEFMAAFAYYREKEFLYRAPDNDEWTDQILDVIPDEDKWAYLSRGLPPKAAAVIEHRYRNGLTLREVSELYGVSKQRISQIELATLASLRSRIEKLEPVRRLFYG